MAMKRPSVGASVICAGAGVAQLYAGDRFRRVGARYFFDRGVPDDFDFRMREQALLQHLFGAQRIAAVEQRHRIGEVGQEQRFLDRGVAAADDRDVLAAIEEAVAGGAGGDAVAFERFFGGQAEPARLRAGGDDQHVAGVDRAAVAGEAERTRLQIGVHDHVIGEFGADMFGLRLHLFHQPGALDRFGEARVVFDVGGDRHLPAGLKPRDDQRLKHGAGGVDRGRVAGWPEPKIRTLTWVVFDMRSLARGPQRRAPLLAI